MFVIIIIIREQVLIIYADCLFVLKYKRLFKDGTGCYTVETDSPWECYYELPDCVNVIKPQFYFYTPEKPGEEQVIDFFNLNETVKALKTAPKIRQFFAVTHGYGAVWPKPWQVDIKDKLVALVCQHQTIVYCTHLPLRIRRKTTF